MIRISDPSTNRLRGNPTRHRSKQDPTNDDLIYKGRLRKAFLAKTIVPFNNADINKTINQLSNLGYWERKNIRTLNNSSPVSRFDLWVEEVNYGFSVSGPKAASKYYTRHYSQSLNLTPLAVSGICYDENEYDDLADFIREGQVALADEAKNVFRIFVPAAKIDCLGAITEFSGGFQSNNTGIPVAPKFRFNFIIFKDLRDSSQSIGSTAKTLIENFNKDPYWVGKFKTYKNDYIVGQLIQETTKNPPNSQQRTAERVAAKKAVVAAASNVNKALKAVTDLF